MAAQYFKGCSLIEAVFTASRKGTPCMATLFTVPTPDEGEIKRTVYLYLSDGAIKYSEEKLEKLGFNGDYSNPKFSSADDVELSLKHEDYEGKPQERWDIAGQGGTFEHKAGPADLARQLSARWRATHKAAAPAKASAPKAPSKAPAKPAAKPLSNATDKDSAWDEYKEMNPGVAEDVISERFYASIEKIGDENEFTAKEWQAVVADTVPF